MMGQYSLSKICDIVSGKLFGSGVFVIDSIALDSRTIVPSGSILFFCLKGKRHDSHIYVSELCKKGVRNFIFEYVPEGADLKGINYVVVRNSVEALQKLATYHRQQFQGKVIGVTGSNGKTIVKEWLWQCLRSEYNVVRSPKSYNSQVGVPLSAWLLEKNTEIGILEAGISMPGEMQNLEKIIQPDIGIFTNIGDAHQENFNDYEEKIREKAKLFQKSEVLIYSSDTKLVSGFLKKTYPEKRHLNWAMRSEGAWLTIRNVEKQSSRSKIEFQTEKSKGIIFIPFSDSASIENAIHVLAVLVYMELPIEKVKETMLRLQPVAMRLELKKGINNCTVVNDSYNSDLNSLDIALDFLNLQRQHKKRTLILSDILQSGKNEKELYSEVALKIKEKNISKFIGIGNAVLRNKQLFPFTSSFFSTTKEFLDKVKVGEFTDEAILIKGSREFQFEQIASLLEEKSHTTVLEINLNAIIHNLNFYRSLIQRDTKIMVMLKAFSYGSGSYEIASVLQNQRVDYFGVAFADEGVTLRKNGITTPIIVMSPSTSDFESLVEYRLEPEIHSFGLLDAFSSFLLKAQVSDFPVHLKFDTGMHRLGFANDEVGMLIENLRQNKNLKVRSVFSHLAASDEPEHDAFTKEQIEIFEAICEHLSSQLKISFLRHILNTNGIERFPNARFEMVRLGIGLYGVSSNCNDKVQNVSTFKSKIVQIKNISAGETVGYGRKGKAIKETKIATIPIGYADGLDRKLSNGNGHFLINGQLAPIIGTICMDLCMIDITGIDANVHDEIVIFGENPNIKTVAEQMGTIPYEVLTKVSQRVKRVYVHE